jgi:hypothetical protein
VRNALFRSLLLSPLLSAALVAAACSNGKDTDTSGSSIRCGPGTAQVGGQCLPSAGNTTVSSGTGGGGIHGAGGGAGSTSSSSTGVGGAGGAATTIVEKPLDVTLALAPCTATTCGAVPDGGTAPSTLLTVTVTDGATPVMTDVWLYTLDNGKLAALTDFDDPVVGAKRRYRGLLNPCTVGGTPSGLLPCDDGSLNGVQTDKVRATLSDGVYAPAIHGTVEVPLSAAPTSVIVVVVAREDQRYYGAAAINPDSSAAAVPAGMAVPETYPLVTYTHDIAPVVGAFCTTCHAPGQINPDHPLDTYDAIVNNNFAYTEQQEDCIENNPSDSAALQACIAAITSVQYIVEPGNPANSGFTQRTVPDVNAGVSAVGLLWYGSKGSRFDVHGDRRMPSSTTTPDAGTEDPDASTFFDDDPAKFQVFYDWVAQGAPK